MRYSMPLIIYLLSTVADIKARRRKEGKGTQLSVIRYRHWRGGSAARRRTLEKMLICDDVHEMRKRRNVSSGSSGFLRGNSTKMETLHSKFFDFEVLEKNWGFNRASSNTFWLLNTNYARVDEKKLFQLFPDYFGLKMHNWTLSNV